MLYVMKRDGCWSLDLWFGSDEAECSCDRGVRGLRCVACYTMLRWSFHAIVGLGRGDVRRDWAGGKKNGLRQLRA